ncbi:MAG: TolC family protein, partial [Candidatus Omnitrophota bacterium]
SKARESYMAIRDKLTFDIKTAYYDLLLVEKLISLYSESKKRMEAYASKLTRRSKVGDVTKYAVLRAKIEIEIMNSDLINVEKEKIRYKAKMQKLLMLDEVRDISPKDGPAYSERETPEEDYSLERVLPAAGNKNRRIKVAKLAKKIGKEEINVATSKAGLRASLRSAWYKSSDKFDLMSHYFYDWSLMINVTVPLFDGLKIPSLINQSRSEYSKLAASESATRKDVFWELEDAVSELKKTRPLLESQRRLAGDAEDGVNMVLVLYDRGEGSEWDVIDAHRNYIRAESNLARFVRDYDTLVAKIKYLLSEE